MSGSRYNLFFEDRSGPILGARFSGENDSAAAAGKNPPRVHRNPEGTFSIFRAAVRFSKRTSSARTMKGMLPPPCTKRCSTLFATILSFERVFGCTAAVRRLCWDRATGSCFPWTLESAVCGGSRCGRATQAGRQSRRSTSKRRSGTVFFFAQRMTGPGPSMSSAIRMHLIFISDSRSAAAARLEYEWINVFNTRPVNELTEITVRVALSPAVLARLAFFRNQSSIPLPARPVLSRHAGDSFQDRNDLRQIRENVTRRCSCLTPSDEKLTKSAQEASRDFPPFNPDSTIIEIR